MRKSPVLALAIAAAIIAPTALAACGGDDDEEQAVTTETTAPAAEGATLQLEADPGGALKYDKDSLSAKSGLVTIELTNPADLSHDVVVEQDGKELAKSELISGGDTSTATAELKAGEYVFFCSVPGHREGGMEGTLTVK
jgi:plastocyanin